MAIENPPNTPVNVTIQHTQTICVRDSYSLFLASIKNNDISMNETPAIILHFFILDFPPFLSAILFTTPASAAASDTASHRFDLPIVMPEHAPDVAQAQRLPCYNDAHDRHDRCEYVISHNRFLAAAAPGTCMFASSSLSMKSCGPMATHLANVVCSHRQVQPAASCGFLDTQWIRWHVAYSLHLTLPSFLVCFCVSMIRSFISIPALIFQ